LTAGQCAGVAAKKWQVRGEFLAKRHDRVFSINAVCAVFRRRLGIVATLEGPFECVRPLRPQRCEDHWNKAPAIWFP
jgi:hypothetical protein